MALLTHEEYLGLGRRIMPLLGSALCGPSADALRELARAYGPSVDDARISAEVFLFHKYLLMQACAGVFPESHVDHIVGGLFAALNERASGLDLNQERQQAMEAMWKLRAEQFDGPFSQDQAQLLDEESGPHYWKETIDQFCQNVHQHEHHSDFSSDGTNPSHTASQSVTAALDEMVSALEEINQQQFGGAA
ncbi:hypothetical protein YTPLAS72_30170 [Nitrospira sp.]|nr:hypothetical protein YTPLAS72_30170 [Nitrospira sp.]